MDFDLAEGRAPARKVAQGQEGGEGVALERFSCKRLRVEQLGVAGDPEAVLRAGVEANASRPVRDRDQLPPLPVGDDRQ